MSACKHGHSLSIKCIYNSFCDIYSTGNEFKRGHLFDLTALIIASLDGILSVGIYLTPPTSFLS